MSGSKTPIESGSGTRPAGESGRAAGRTARAIRLLALCCPWMPEVDPAVEQSIAFLDWSVDPETLLRAGDGAGVVVVAAALVAAVIASLPLTVAVAVAAVTGAGAAAAARYVPQLLATARRTRALGEAPGLVSRAVLRMRLSPTPETAAAFAAETGSGRLATSLSAHVERARGDGRSGLGSFADEWAEWFPSLRRALTLVESAGRAPSGERERALETALDATLSGTRESMTAFADSIRGPATAIYAFGVLLPLALVALLPAAATIGVEASPAVVALLYDLCLPAVLLTASAWLLARRPAAFPPPAVSRDHPDVSDRRWLALAAGCLAGAAAWVAARHAVAPWTGVLAGPGVGAGVALVLYFQPLTDVHERVRAVEDGLPDALYLVGREVQRGRAVEGAIADAADSVDTETGAVLADAVRQQRQLGIGVRESFLGEHGALAAIPSERARSTAELLALSSSEGRPAGTALVAMADHVDDLQSVERETRRELQRVTSTLSNTAMVFAPLVGGATITLAERMAIGGPLSDSGVAPSQLGLAVGGYVLVLSVLVTALATGLARGLDRSLVGYRAGRALLSATGVFLVALVATRALV